MGIDKAFKDSYQIFKDNLIFILPHFFEYILDFGMLIVFGVFAALLIGVSLLRATFSSFQSPEALLSHLGASGFFIIFLLILAASVLILATIIFSAFARTAIIGMAKESLELKKTSLGAGWENIKKHGLNVFGFTVLLGILLIPIIIIGFIPTILLYLLNASGFLQVASLFLSFLLTFLLIAVVYILIMFAPQCIVLDSVGIFDGIKRSYAFVRNNVFLVLKYLVIAAVISIFVFIATFVIFFPLNYITKSSAVIRLGVNFFENLFSLAIGLVLAPYFEIVKTHLVAEWKLNETIN